MVGLIIMTSCNNRKVLFELQHTLSIDGFPSGSSLEYYNKHLYLTGDDATQLLILDEDYNITDSLSLFKHGSIRIPKNEKADLESSTIFSHNQTEYLAFIGSASLPTREKMLLVPLNGIKADTTTELSTKIFMNRLLSAGLQQVNIEGTTTINDFIVFANRGNLTFPHNELVVTNKDFWKRQQEASIKLIKVNLPTTEHFTGISGLHYVIASDVLFFVASTELTENSYDDGAIGKSYIGWVRNMSKVMNDRELSVSNWVDLEQADERFTDQKIEGLCTTAVADNVYTVHLVSDNDDGKSKLFKLHLKLNN